jgi:putative Ca2+/H+ antiporter (TMEM165/GDT1 family)
VDLSSFLIIFASVFAAELGDKTQVATLLFASDRQTSKLMVFAASASALVCTSALGVLAGGVISEHVSPRVLRVVAGGGFIAVGLWVLLARGE